MATLNENPRSKAVKGKNKKIAPRVDFTAMVDLMFLLTTSLSSLNAADIAKPDRCDKCTMDYPASRTMTILLGKNNLAVSYLGVSEDAEMKITPVAKIDEQIRLNKLSVAKTHQNNAGKPLLVIIKPSKTAKFQNFVDVIDEMKIAGIKSYTIDDEHFDLNEADFLKAKGL